MTEKAMRPSLRFDGFTDAWEQRKVGELLTERNEQAPMSEEYPLMAFIANEGVAPKGDRYDRSSLVSDTENKPYKKTDFGDFIYSSNNLETGSIGLNKYGKASISPVYSIFQPTGIADSDFLGRRLVRKDFINAMVKWRQGVIYGQWRIHESDFAKIEIPVPTVEEQRQIGAFLDSLDNLITLHQRKYDKLINLKKAMLEKMFPEKGEVVPKIRFSGFTDAWEQRKLSEMTSLLQNNTLSRAELTTEGGTAFDVHYGDVLIKFGGYLDIKKELLPMIMDGALPTKYKASFLHNGDVIVADTAEDETVGKCSEIAGLTDEIVISGLHTIPYRPLFKFASGYLGYYMNSTSYHHQLFPLMQGIKVTSISKSAMQNTIIYYPKSEGEQAEISTYFRNLDNLITLHQRELEKMQNIKKACLEKMFI